MGSENGAARRPFAIIAQSWAAEGTTLSVIGDLDSARLGALREAVQVALGEGHRHLVIDLSATTFLDCAAVQELLRAVGPLQDDAGAAVVLAGVTGAPRRLLDMLRFDAVIGTVESSENAIAACCQQPNTLPDGWRRTRLVR
jgi:anti-sigma B factor antagonist